MCVCVYNEQTEQSTFTIAFGFCLTSLVLHSYSHKARFLKVDPLTCGAGFCRLDALFIAQEIASNKVILYIILNSKRNIFAVSALTLLVGRQEGHLACKKTEWWGAGVVICLKQGADLHMAQLMPLPLTVSSFSEIQIGFTFLVPAHLGSPRKRAIKQVCVS